jgi:hypothetical protein
MEINIDLLDIFCEFEHKDDNTYVCKLCNNRMSYVSKDGEIPKIPCVTKLSKPIPVPKVQHQQPALHKKIFNFIVAVYNHIRNGGKRTTLEERTKRLNICTGCEYYDGIACTKCGCPITRYQQYISKLDWKDQKCPIGKW